MRYESVVGATLVAALGTLGSRTPATAVVTGTAMDPTTHAPLVGAVVTADGLADSATVAANGRYVLRGIPRDTATLRVRKTGYHDVIVPRLLVGTDTLHFDVELHTNPVTRMNKRGNLPEPLMLVRFSADSLAGTIGRDSMYLMPLKDSIEAVDVLTGRGLAAKNYGLSASGGAIRVVMRKATRFPFADFGNR